MKTTIKNRKGLKIVTLLELEKKSKGLVLLMHGLGGVKEAPHLEVIAESFRKHGYSVLRFDTTNSFGESDGKYEDATTTNYYEDLEDVINWAKKQSWFTKPFCLVGHSLGGICIALYAEKHPEEIKALAPISTVVSGKLSVEATPKEDMLKWEKTGWQQKPSSSKPGLVKRLKFSHIQDRLKYDLLPNAKKLIMPVLMIVGEKDDRTPPEHERILYDKLPGKKEFYIIKGAPHTFKDKNHLDQISKIFNHWIESL